ncbi:MAG: PEGA domain-containing protein [Spirochaetia bacterium]
MRSTEIGQKEVTGPGSAELPTGEYDVEASCPGLPGVSGKVTINRGANASWLPWPKGYLDVQSDPAGASIVVDGKERGAAPLVVEVEPGTQHRVEVRKEKYETYVMDISATAADKTSVTTALVALPGSIRVETSMTGANVQLEGQSGKTPFLFDKVRAGRQVVRILDLRVGDRMYTVGDSVQVEVSPGETTLVSETFVEGKGRLIINDAPSGSIVTIDGKSVDSEKILTTGIDVPAGWMAVEVQGPTSQRWTTDTAFVGAGRVSRQSIHEMTAILPRRTISMDGKADSREGIEPSLIVPSDSTFLGERGIAISRVYMCRNDKDLFWRVDFNKANPLVKHPKAMNEGKDRMRPVHIFRCNEGIAFAGDMQQPGQSEPIIQHARRKDRPGPDQRVFEESSQD